MKLNRKLIALPLLLGLLCPPGFAQPEQTLPGVVPGEDIAGTAPSIHPMVTTGSSNATQQVDWREEYAYALGMRLTSLAILDLLAQTALDVGNPTA